MPLPRRFAHPAHEGTRLCHEGLCVVLRTDEHPRCSRLDLIVDPEHRIAAMVEIDPHEPVVRCRVGTRLPREDNGRSRAIPLALVAAVAKQSTNQPGPVVVVHDQLGWTVSAHGTTTALPLVQSAFVDDPLGRRLPLQEGGRRSLAGGAHDPIPVA